MRLHLLIMTAITLVGHASAQDLPRCSESEIYAKLDFWVGEWDVFVGENQVGENRIEKTLDGCAILEHWTARDGGEGKSLFFVDYDRHWAQIWVTQWAMAPGGVKEKVMVDDPPEGAVRFQGVIRHAEAGAWLDRTTLTPSPDGTVRQLIERSEDGGESWYPTFDAIYRPRTP